MERAGDWEMQRDYRLLRSRVYHGQMPAAGRCGL